jgi:hypothetical protein
VRGYAATAEAYAAKAEACAGYAYLLPVRCARLRLRTERACAARGVVVGGYASPSSAVMSVSMVRRARRRRLRVKRVHSYVRRALAEPPRSGRQ